MVAVRFWKLGLGGLLNASDRKVIGSRRNRYFSSSLLFVSLFQCSVALEVIPALKVSKGLVFICTCDWIFYVNMHVDCLSSQEKNGNNSTFFHLES